MPQCVWTLTVIARFDVTGSNCLSCEHKREVFGKHRVKRERERGPREWLRGDSIGRMRGKRRSIKEKTWVKQEKE